MENRKIRVLIVEDSLVGQKLLKGLVLSDERFELLAVADNGKQAYDYVMKFKPDIVSMDIQMPVMDGVEATRRIMQELPVPVVIVSSFYNSSEVEMAMNVLEAGAVNIIPRPHGPGHPKFSSSSKSYLNTLKIMSEVKVVRRRKAAAVKREEPRQEIIQSSFASVPPASPGPFQVLAIGASAGGPEGIRTILSCLPKNFPLPVLIVQHIDANFAEGFCTWLNTFSNIPVHIGQDNQKILPGNAYMPPGDHHLSVKSKNTLCVTRQPEQLIHRPSVNILFKGIGEIFGPQVLAVLLSGMGKDGAAELKKLKDAGAVTLVQDEASCLVFGMPGEAVKSGAAGKVLPPDKIAVEIINLLNIHPEL